MYLERLRTRALESLEGFLMYTHYGRVGAIPTYRVYRLSDNVTWHNFEHVGDNVETTPSAALAERLSCRNSADTSYSKELYVKARRYI